MKKPFKKKAVNVGSIVTGIGLGVLLSFWLNYIYSFDYSLYIYLFVLCLFLGFMGYYKPKLTEITAYAVSIFVILQMAWDFPVLDRSEIRTHLFILSLSSLIINVFSGFYRWKAPIKIFKKALGIS